MLFLNLQRVFQLRDVKNPYSKLMKIGISSATASNLLNYRVQSINHKHLEKICELLNCEPNDLYEWKPSDDTPNPENHPLKNLKRDDSSKKISEMLKNIPLEKFNQVEELLNELKES